MNILCRDIESIDFEIQWGKTEESKLPYYDLDSFKFDPEILKQFRAMYQKWNNKKSISYIDTVFSAEDDVDYKECKFGILDAVRVELQEIYKSLNLTAMEGLTYIKALSNSYTKFNWGFAWELIDTDILDCIEENDALAPVQCENGTEYLGRKYILKHIPKNNKNYTIDYETGEIHFEDIDGLGGFEIEDFNFEDLEDLFDEDLDNGN